MTHTNSEEKGKLWLLLPSTFFTIFVLEFVAKASFGASADKRCKSGALLAPLSVSVSYTFYFWFHSPARRDFLEEEI